MRNVNIKIASSVLGLGLVLGLATSAAAGVPSVAQNDAAKVGAPVDYVHWYCHRHWHRHYFTQLVAAGTVTYPVYRVERYKIDYSAPTFVTPVVASVGWWFW